MSCYRNIKKNFLIKRIIAYCVHHISYPNSNLRINNLICQYFDNENVAVLWCCCFSKNMDGIVLLSYIQRFLLNKIITQEAFLFRYSYYITTLSSIETATNPNRISGRNTALMMQLYLLSVHQSPY